MSARTSIAPSQLDGVNSTIRANDKSKGGPASERKRVAAILAAISKCNELGVNAPSRDIVFSEALGVSDHEGISAARDAVWGALKGEIQSILQDNAKSSHNTRRLRTLTNAILFLNSGKNASVESSTDVDDKQIVAA